MQVLETTYNLPAVIQRSFQTTVFPYISLTETSFGHGKIFQNEEMLFGAIRYDCLKSVRHSSKLHVAHYNERAM